MLLMAGEFPDYSRPRTAWFPRQACRTGRTGELVVERLAGSSLGAGVRIWNGVKQGPRGLRARCSCPRGTSPRVANLARSQSTGRLTHPFNRAAGGWLLCRHADAAQKKPRRSGAKLGGGACRPTPSPAHEGQSRSRAPEFGGKPRQNVEPSRWFCISACTAGRLSSSIASRTALAAGWLSNAVAACTASRAA
jgi:hypothetical protein